MNLRKTICSEGRKQQEEGDTLAEHSSPSSPATPTHREYAPQMPMRYIPAVRMG